ncbi:MAG: hypothetical protein JNK04_21460 [Myxococcales bacterium]|nr:hypothetical protein [Myxococcales bacterium]
MRAFDMTRPSPARFLLIAAPLVIGLAGCELIAAVDHDLIGSGGSGAGPSTGGAGGNGSGPVGGEGGAPVGGNGGNGGSGGGPECTGPERCADPPACQTVACNNENCEAGADVAEGTACEISAGVPGVCFEGTAADGDGSCVECVDNTQCTNPDTCDTDTHQCEGPLCGNLTQDPGETGIDCGGPSCGPCDNTQGCLVAGDCLSGFCNALQCDPCATNANCAGNQWCDTTLNGGTCVPDKANGQACTTGDGECTSGNCNPIGGGTSMCCDTACAGTCRSCAFADTGTTNGTCDDISVGTDPKNQCADHVNGVDCNTGNCAAGGTCGFQAAATACNDGLFCTATDACNAGGTCVGTGNPCVESDDSCEDSCNEGANDCTAANPATTPCDENNDLTVGACDGTLGANNCVGD